jgi:predicted amidohydrolase
MRVNMKIALLQSNIIWENKLENLKKLNEYLDYIRDNSIDIEMLLLPEMSFTGFSMSTDITKENDKWTIKKIQKLAKEYNIAIGIGWVNACHGEDEGLSENHYSIISKKGEELLDYVKIHPFSYAEEDKYFKAGKKLNICEINGIKIGVLLCYDLRFPEIFQKLSKESDMIIVPANWPANREKHWEYLLIARAIENQSYIAGINCCGHIGKLYYSGNSTLINPNGDICVGEDIHLDSTKINEEKLLIYDIINDVNKFREEFPVKRDRREDFYNQL